MGAIQEIITAMITFECVKAMSTDKFSIYFVIRIIVLLSIIYIMHKYKIFNMTEFGSLSSLKNELSIHSKSSDKSELLDDSDDDNDDISIALNDLKYNEEDKSNKPNGRLKNLEIVSIKNMINKDTISNINDIIALANYYEKHILPTIENQNNDNDGTTIDNLYKYGKKYYPINLKKVYNIKCPLIKLKKMIGLEEIKNNLIDVILYYMINFEKTNNDMMHITLEGPPGCGKTKLAKIIGKILNKMCILKSDKIVYAKSTDLIGEYIGQSGPKTQKVVDSAMGGILFIDEVYSLGSSFGHEHNFSAETINVLNQNLSDNKKNFICIIAGYSDEIEKMFF